MSLDRFASMGAGFADNPAAVARHCPGLRNIAVFGPDGESRAVLASAQRHGAGPAGTGRSVFAFGPQAGLAFSQGERRIVVLFDKQALAPEQLLAHAALLPASGPALLPLNDTGDLDWTRTACRAGR